MNEEWSRVFTRVNWRDGAQGGTPLSAAKLNQHDEALAIIDQRVVEVGARLAEQESLIYSLPEENYEYEIGLTEDKFENFKPLLDEWYGTDVSLEDVNNMIRLQCPHL